MSRFSQIAFALFGVAGVVVLVGLGVWQLQRLEEKEGVLARINAQITREPVALPVTPDPEADAYLAVQVAGRYDDGFIMVQVSRKFDGAGVRIIAPFITEGGRRILVDRGYLRQINKDVPQPVLPAHLIGNLLWPDETDGFTPPPDLEAGLWFARDAERMAQALGTEPLMLVLSQEDGTGATADPMPVSSAGIPNDHLGYALTWFSLAFIWAVMCGYALWRYSKRQEV